MLVETLTILVTILGERLHLNKPWCNLKIFSVLNGTFGCLSIREHSEFFLWHLKMSSKGYLSLLKLHTLPIGQFSKIQKIRFELVSVHVITQGSQITGLFDERRAHFSLNCKWVWQMLSWKLPRSSYFWVLRLEHQLIVSSIYNADMFSKIRRVWKFQVPLYISLFGETDL